MRSLLIVAGLCGLFLGWNAPNHYPPWPTFHLEMFAGFGLCLLGVAAISASRTMSASSARPLRVPTSVWVWFAAATVPLMQYASGQLYFRGDALIGCLYAMGVGFGVYVGHALAAQHGRARVSQALCLTIVVGGLTANALALMQWLRLPAPSWWAMELIDDRPFANFGQPNHFGLLMVMAMIALTALFEMRVIERRWVHRLALAFLGLGVLVSGSRASALSVLALGGLWLSTQRRVASRLGWRDLVLAIAGALLMAVAAEVLQKSLLTTPADARTTTDVGARQWIWLHYAAAIRQHPWIGYGFNQGVAAMAEVASQVHPSRNTPFAHNLLLDLMAWFGVPLALLLAGALVVWTAGWLRKTHDQHLMAQRHAVFAIWMALAIQSMLEFPYAHTYFLLPAALLAGAVTTPGSTHTAAGAQRGVRWLRPLGALAVVLFGVLVWEYFQIESDFRFNRFDRANFSVKVDHQSLQSPWVLDQLAALNASAKNPPAAGLSDADLEARRRLARRFHIPSVRLEYAQALALNGRLADAEHELLVIRSVNPPQTFERIERSWRAWLAAHASTLPATALPR